MDLPTRVTQLEAVAEKTSVQLVALEKDVAVIRSNYATKEDIAQLRGELYKAINDQTWKMIMWMTGISTALVAATFFIARFVK